MKTIDGYYLIRPEDLSWRLSNLMKIPNADYLERTGSENMGARLWRRAWRSCLPSLPTTRRAWRMFDNISISAKSKT